MFGGEARQTRGNEWGRIGNSHAGVSRFSGEADKGGPGPVFSVLAWAWRQGRNLIKFGRAEGKKWTPEQLVKDKNR